MRLQAVSLADQAVLWSAGSVLFVWVLMALHLRSRWLATLGIWQILAALPISWLLYALFVPMTAAISTLAFFVLVGIGADDLFVFMSAWQLERFAPAPDEGADAGGGGEEAGGESSGGGGEDRKGTPPPGGRRQREPRSEAEHVEAALARAGPALLTTSLTTALSFWALALTPLPVVSSLGIFAGLSVAIDYALTLTLWPCLVILHERHPPRQAAAAAVSCALSWLCSSELTVRVRHGHAPLRRVSSAEASAPRERQGAGYALPTPARACCVCRMSRSSSAPSRIRQPATGAPAS